MNRRDILKLAPSLAALARAPSAFAGFGFFGGAVAAPALNVLGVNVNGPIGYATGPMWLNALRQCGSNTRYCPWFTGNGSTFDTGEEAYLAPTLDANGNPTTLTVSGIPGGQQFTKLFTYIYDTGSPPSGAATSYPVGSYTMGFKVAGTGGATTLTFQVSGDVSSLATTTSGVSVAGSTVTSTLAPGQNGVLTFTTSSGTGPIVITVPAGSAISTSCYIDFASGYLVETAYLSNYTAGQVLHPNFKAEFSGGYNGPLRWMTDQMTNQIEWQATFNATLASGATSGTLSTLTQPSTSDSTWPWPTGNKYAVFGTGTGQVQQVSGTYGSAAVTWGTGLAASVASSAIGAMAIISEFSGWANRPTLSNLSWCGPQGPPLEALIQACNELGRDCWLCVPASARLIDSTYVSNLATLAYNGSNATLGDNLASFSGLSSAQKCHVEFANETWNAGAAYKQANLCYLMSVPLGFYAAQGNNQYYGGEEWKGYQTGLIAADFSSVYGSQFSSRVLPVVMSQFTGAQGAAYIKVAMNTPDDTARAYTKGILGYGFAPYWGTDSISVADATTIFGLANPVNEMFSILYTNVGASTNTYSSVATAGLIGGTLSTVATQISDLTGQPWSGYPIVGYEGGSALDDASNIEASVSGWRVNVLNAMQLDSRFAYCYSDLTHQLSANNGYLPGLQAAGFKFICQLSDVSGMLTHTSPPGGANWGALQSVMQLPSSPTSKFTGIKNWIAA